jgi:MFS family permease
MKSRKPSLLIIFLTVFIDLIGFGIVLPLLPRYSEKYGAEGFMIGVIIASFSIMQFLLAPFWGRLSDRIGRRPVLLLSNAGSTISYALFAWASMPGWSGSSAMMLILMSRIFAGACGANISVASAYIADVTPPEKRSKGMAIIGVAFGLGFILGPALGAMSASWFGLAGPGWMAAAICAANFCLATVILAESRHPGAKPAPGRPGLDQWRRVLARPQAGLLVGIYFLATFCFASFETTLPLLVGSPSFHPDDFQDPVALARRIETGEGRIHAIIRGTVPEYSRESFANAEDAGPRLLREMLFADLNDLLHRRDLSPEGLETAAGPSADGAPPRVDARRNRLALEAAFLGLIRPQTLYFSEKRLGYIFAFCGLIATLVQGAVGRLVKRMGEARLIISSLALFAVSLIMLPYVGTLGMLLVALALVSAGSGINRAPTLGLLSILTPPEEQGSALGVAQSAGTLARILGPILATAIYGYRPHLTYVVASLLAFVAVLWAWKGLDFKRPSSHHSS